MAALPKTNRGLKTISGRELTYCVRTRRLLSDQPKMYRARGKLHLALSSLEDQTYVSSDDSKSRTNCVVSAGKLQLAIQDAFQTGRPATNGYVRGLTFTGASSINVLAIYPSDVEFHDCIFRVCGHCGGKNYLSQVSTLKYDVQ
jgi:hypothetical protein